MQWSHSTLGEPVFIIIMGHPTFQFVDTSLSSLLQRGVGLSLSSVAICLTQFSLKVIFALLF